jgi:hypothetical protein
MTASLPVAASRSLPKRIAASLLAIGLATSVAVIGSTASWTAQTQNAGNSVTAGTLDLTNDRNGTALFEATGVKPGESGATTVTLKNAGSTPIAVTLTQDQVVNGFAASSMKLQIHDSARNWCYYPTSAAGACSGYGTWSDAAKLTSLALPATDGSAKWAAGETHAFRVGWKLDTSSPNSDQGKTASFRLVWDGIQ